MFFGVLPRCFFFFLKFHGGNFFERRIRVISFISLSLFQTGRKSRGTVETRLKLYSRIINVEASCFSFRFVS